MITKTNTVDVQVVCWSDDENRVLVIANGRRIWKAVTYQGEERPQRGYIDVDGKRVCVA